MESKLGEFLPSPRVPLASPPWASSLEEVGILFPGDYQAFINGYGAGTISSLDKVVTISIASPTMAFRSNAGGRGFLGFTELTTVIDPPYFGLDDVDGGYYGGISYPVFPDPGGLLEWGSSDDGDKFYWLTEDSDPNNWTIVELPRHESVIYTFDGGMVEFLLAILSKRYVNANYYVGVEPTWTLDYDWLINHR